MHKQNALFQYFSDTFDCLIEMDKKEGRYDMGILGKLQGRAGRYTLCPGSTGALVASEAHCIRYMKPITEWL